ncbi:MAG: DUF1641 domain-containing protein [Mobilicoccus sp.]|nr:DUF1641 domain-containing protein [Mobilicoccus sp.]
MSELAARLSDPKVAEALTTVLEHADLLAVLVEGLDGLLRRTELIGENVTDVAREAVSMAVAQPYYKDAVNLPYTQIATSLVEVAAVVPRAVPGLLHFVNSGVIENVIDSDMVTPEAVDAVSVVARGMVRGTDRWRVAPLPVTGPVTLTRLLRDADIQRAISYAACVAKAVGQELAVHQAHHATTATTTPTTRSA